MENKDIIRMYNNKLHDERIRLGRFASITAFIITPIFYLKDVYMTRYIYSTLFWRMLPAVLAVIFMILSYTKFKDNYIIVKTSYITLVYSVLVMMLGVFYTNYGTNDGYFNSFLIAGLIMTLLVIQIFSSPIRKYIKYLVVLVIIFFIVTLIVKGGDAFTIANLINPSATIILISIFSYINEKKSFNEFKSNVLLELSERDLRNEIEYRKGIEEGLEHVVLHDTLTGSYNRRAAELKLGKIFEEFKKNNQRFTVVFIDLDDLKKINDSEGHESGDRYLIAFVKTVSNILDNEEHLFRVGGDEFIIFMEDYELDRVYEVIEETTLICNDLSIQFSYGISSTHHYKDIDLEGLIKEADIKMYNQKRLKKQTS